MIYKTVAKNLPRFTTLIGVPMPLADTGPRLPAGTGSSQHPAAKCLLEVVCNCVGSTWLTQCCVLY